MVIHALNAAARGAGLSRGQTQADALAMLPTLDCRPADLAADRLALQVLAGWCERWSPSVTLDPEPEGLEGLFLDITGGAHLFGGEAALVGQMEDRLAQAGARARVAVADTPGAAWALARWGGETRVLPQGRTREGLADLPIDALRLDEATLRQARRFGLKRIGDVCALPRAGLARRFRNGAGLGLVTRLDQALGQTGEALAPTRAPPRYRAFQAYAEPIDDIAGVEGRLPELADDLAAALERDGQGARALTVTGFRTDGQVTALSVRLGLASRETRVWLRLFKEKGVERLDLGFGIDALMLAADETAAMAARQPDLQDNAAARHAESLALLIDRLTARLGPDHVLVSEPHGSWLPERAERWRPAQGGAGLSSRIQASSDIRRRPLMLLDPPEALETIAGHSDGAPAMFTWRRSSRRVRRADGPERLSPEWWRPRADERQVRTRDYYRVEDNEGLRYWLFREGLYEAEAAEPRDPAPSWWMHGLFS